MLGFLTTEQRAELIKLYIAFFNRAPEFQGLEFHSTKILEDMESGLSFEQALTNRADVFFVAGLAFPSSGYSLSQTLEEFVETMYSNVLLRPGAGGDAPTQAEKTYWVDRLESGEITRGQMAQEMLAAVDTLISQGTPEEMAVSLQVQAALNNRVTVAEAFAQPEISGNLTGDEAVQAGIDALMGVTADPATIQPAIDAFTKPPQTFIYTQDVDVFQGGDGDDTFIAGDSGLLFPNPLQPGDSADGGAGTDLLNIIDNGVTQIVPNIMDIENIFINSFGALFPTTVNFINSGGVEQIWNDRSTATVNANNIQDDVILGARETNSNFNTTFSPGAITDGSLTTLFQDAGVWTGFPSETGGPTGPDMDLNVNLNGNSVDTLNIWSNGMGVGNHIDIDITNNGGTLTHINITPGPLGDALGERPIDAELDGPGFGGVTNVDATTLSEDLILDIDASDGGVTIDGGTGNTTIFAGSGADTITTQDGNDYVDDEGAIGGPQLIQTAGGNDQVILNGSVNTILLGTGDDLLDSELSPLTIDDSYDGGLGFDSLVLDIENAIAATNTAGINDRVDGFEQLILRGERGPGGNDDVFLNELDNINDVVINADLTSGADLDLEEMRSGGRVTFALTVGAAVGTILIDGPSTDGNNDEFTFIIAAGSEDVTGEVDLTDVETLNIMTEGTTLADNIRLDLDIGSPFGTGTETVILTGVAGVDLNNVGTTDYEQVTLFDASGITGTGEIGAVDVFIDNDSDGATILGGSGNDSLVSTGSFEDDVITGNAGEDFIRGGQGADILTGDGPEVGSFADIFFYGDDDESREFGGAGVDTITDFETGVDILQFSEAGIGIEGNFIDFEGNRETNGAAIALINANTGDATASAAYASSTQTAFIDTDGDGWDFGADDMVIVTNAGATMQQADFDVLL